MDHHQPLIDRFGRIHTNLRVSVTDHCNIRCFYCMPETNVQFRPKEELLTFEEITQFVEVASSLGVNAVRLTGGEPLVRRDLPQLVRMLAELPGVKNLALTTNGILLPQHASALRDAGLDRLNISLDTLNEETFRKIARRDGLREVIAGIDAAIDAGFANIRLNAIAFRGITEHEIERLVGFAVERKVEMRFIEFMPLDAEQNWSAESVLTGDEIRKRIEARWGALSPVVRDNPSQPAVDYETTDGVRVGFINPVSEPFCDGCNRLRLTAEGKIRNCLFSTEEWDARAVLRDQSYDGARLKALIRDCVSNKRAGHGIDDPHFVRPERSMYQIGG